eukprot:10702439-Karenia_brevis.AAC.1
MHVHTVTFWEVTPSPRPLTRPSDDHVLRHTCTEGHDISPVSASTRIHMYGKRDMGVCDDDDDDHNHQVRRMPEDQCIYIAVKALCT